MLLELKRFKNITNYPLRNKIIEAIKVKIDKVYNIKTFTKVNRLEYLVDITPLPLI